MLNTITMPFHFSISVAYKNLIRYHISFDTIYHRLTQVILIRHYYFRDASKQLCYAFTAIYCHE